MGKVKTKKAKKVKVKSAVKSAVSSVASAVGAKIKGGGKGGVSRRKSHGPAWYARQILKLKLKKKYEKAKLGMYR